MLWYCSLSRFGSSRRSCSTTLIAIEVVVIALVGRIISCSSKFLVKVGSLKAQAQLGEMGCADYFEERGGNVSTGIEIWQVGLQSLASKTI